MYCRAKSHIDTESITDRFQAEALESVAWKVEGQQWVAHYDILLHLQILTFNVTQNGGQYLKT